MVNIHSGQDFVLVGMDAEMWRLIGRVALKENVPKSIAHDILLMWGIERWSGLYLSYGTQPFEDYRRERRERENAVRQKSED